jgi:hypothetical protein
LRVGGLEGSIGWHMKTPMLADTRRACRLLQEATDRMRERVEAVGGFHISPDEARK